LSSSRARPKRRAVVALVCAASLVAVPTLSRASDSDDPRAERDDVRQQAADVAAHLDALQADAQDVADALQAVTENVQNKRARLNDARRAARTARQEAVVARAEEQRLEQLIETLQDQVAELAVSAYIRPPQNELAEVYDTTDINDTTMATALLGTQNNQQRDSIDQLRAAEDDLSAQRIAAEQAAQQAELLRGRLDDQVRELRAAQEQQRELARQVDERINQATAEAAALADRDRELSDQIAEEAAQFAQYIQGINLGSAGPIGQPYQSGPVCVQDAGNGINVNCSIVGQVHDMIVAAAGDGVTLTGGGYRDSAQQIALRQAHCGGDIYSVPASSCSPPTAIPGTSMHEQGLAIDFDNCSYGSSVYNWLSGHAASYGLYNLPSESWHWSTTGG
jgi:hypothetical protein